MIENPWHHSLLLIPLLPGGSLVCHLDLTIMHAYMTKKQRAQQKPIPPENPIPLIPFEQILEQKALPCFQAFCLSECCFQEGVDIIHAQCSFPISISILVIQLLSGAKEAMSILHLFKSSNSSATKPFADQQNLLFTHPVLPG